MIAVLLDRTQSNGEDDEERSEHAERDHPNQKNIEPGTTRGVRCIHLKSRAIGMRMRRCLVVLAMIGVHLIGHLNLSLTRVHDADPSEATTSKPGPRRGSGR